MEGLNKALGKGLADILGNITTQNQIPNESLIDIKFIKPGKGQPRTVFLNDKHEELVSSIKEKGILQPLIVRKLYDNSYEIIAGERRYRAAKDANLTKVPCSVIECNDRQAIEIGLVENLQRSNLNPIDEAISYQRLSDEFNLTQEQIAKSVGKSRSYITNTIRLLNLDEAIKKLIVEGEISAGHARAILGADNAQQIAQEIIDNKLSVRQAENLVKLKNSDLVENTSASVLELTDYVNKDINAINQYMHNDMHNKSDKITHKKSANEDIEAIVAALEQKLQMKVKLKVNNNNSGELSVVFKNMQDFEKILHLIN